MSLLILVIPAGQKCRIRLVVQLHVLVFKVRCIELKALNMAGTASGSVTASVVVCAQIFHQIQPGTKSPYVSVRHR